MDFTFDVRQATIGGGGGGGSVTQVGTGTGLTGGPITTIGTILFASIDSGLLLANITGSSAAPIPNSLSDILDFVLDDTQGDIIYRNATGWTFLPPGTAGEVLTTGGPSANPAWMPGGGSPIFNPQDTIYFAVGGDDSHPGTLTEPLATLTQAVANANTLLIGGANFVSIIGLGIGVDTGNISITRSGIDIYAPGFQLNPVSGDALTINITLGGVGGSYFRSLLASSTVTSGAKVVNLINYVTGNNNVTNVYFIGQVTGDVYLAKECEYYSTIVTGVLTALQPSTKATCLYGFGSISQQTRLNLEGIAFGANGTIIQGAGSFTNNFRYPMRKLVQLTGNYTLQASDSGLVFVNATTNAYTVTLPQVSNQGTPAFNVGYETEFINLSTGSITFAVQGSDVLIGTSIINVEGQRAIALEEAAGVWTVDAQAGSGSVTEVNTGAGLTGGPITTSGTISFANAPANFMLANLTGSPAPSLPHSVSDVLDSVFTATQGSILYRSNAVWSYLTPGTAGNVLTTGGPSENPAWMPGGSGGVTGGVNLGAGTGVFASTVLPNLEFRTLVGGAGISLSNDANTITITNTGGGGSFEYEDTLWVAQNGSDSNDGKSINTPKLTIAGAISAFVTPTTPTLINIADNGLYTINHTTVTSQQFGIVGKGARLQSLTGGTACFNVVTASDVILDVGVIQNNISGDVLTLAGGVVTINTPVLSGNVSGHGTFRGYFDNWNGNGSLTGGNFYLLGNIWMGGLTATAGITYITANEMSGSVVMSGSANLVGNVALTGSGFTVSNTGTGFVVGNFGNAVGQSQSFGNSLNINNQFISQEIYDLITVTSDFSPLSNQSNKLFLYNSNSNGTCTLTPYGINPNFEIGYRISVCQQQAGNVKFVSGDPIESVQNKLWTEGRGSIVIATIMAIGPNPMAPDQTVYFWSLSGMTAGSATSDAQGAFVYVSQLTGDDTTGIGTETQPYETVSAAVTAIGAPTNNATIFINDDQSYDETITLSYPGISIIGTDATLNCTTADTLVINGSAAGTNYINVGTIQSDGGNSIHMVASEAGGVSNLIVDAGFVNPGPVVTSSTYTCFIRAAQINANLDTTVGGSINYATPSYTGTDSGGRVLGISPSGTEQNFTVGGFFNAAGLEYPQNDSLPGYVVTTDGGGNLTLQPPSSVVWSGISGTSQAAAINNGYVVQNSAQTTITLPSSMNVGQTVIVKGLGAGGWVLAANAGQTIVSPGVSTSSGGTLTSANQYDAISVTGIVENTVWSLDWTTSTGLTPT